MFRFVVVFLLVAVVAGFKSHVLKVALNKRGTLLSSPFISSSTASSSWVPIRLFSKKEDGQDDLVQNLLLTKDAMIQAKDETIRSKDDTIQAKDGELHRALKAMDAMIQAKDEELQRMLKTKDETIRAKDDELHRALKATDKTIRAKDENLVSVKSQLAQTTATLWLIEGKLNLRNAIEKFEDRAPLKHGGTQRTTKWSAMLEANTDNIAHLLLEEDRPMTAAEVDRWARAAKDLYKALSTMVHTSRDMEIIINAARLNPDPLKLAICTAKATPIPYRVVNEPDEETTGGEKSIADGGSGDVDVAAVAKGGER